MDDLDRLFQRLVHNIRFRNPEYLTVPFTVQELYESLVPYRHHRRELGIETNQDYETAVARLLSGERGYARTDPALQDKLRKELASVSPDPGIFRDDAAATVSLDPAALEKFGIPQSGAVAASVASVAPGSAVSGDPGQTATASAAIPSMESVEVLVGCRFCGGTLPEGRRVTYCPHCGMNLATRRCEGCGTELEQGWRYCVNCGKKTG